MDEMDGMDTTTDAHTDEHGHPTDGHGQTGLKAVER